MQLLFNLLLLLMPLIEPLVMLNISENSDYIRNRDQIIKQEQTYFVGGKLNLTDKEIEVNKVILNLKIAELMDGYMNNSNYLPAHHFFNTKKRIAQSKVFEIIKKIPKGGSLHTHYLAGVSIDYIIDNITDKENIYGGYINGVFKLKFFDSSDSNINSTWKSLKEFRKNDSNFDMWLKEQLSIEVDNPGDAYPTPNAVWTKFKKTFTTQYDMVCYRPVFEIYIYQLLKELYLDNVMYTELRGTSMPLYELNGTVYNNEDFFNIFIETVNKFKKDYPNFLGVKYIHSVYRGVSQDDLRQSLNDLLLLKNKFPDFISGFDFVGYEEEGNSLYNYHEVLLEFQPHLQFFFHAGETNWFGHTDRNLIDAVLLNSSRIGHGFGLNKHPVITEMAKDKNICVELCPISNQVLKLIDDIRNHPMIGLMSMGFPVVICNDDPALWGSTGLSYDWYITFIAMTPQDAGLEVLKQFAINSINYSSMTEVEKTEGMRKWEELWEEFLDNVLSTYKH